MWKWKLTLWLRGWGGGTKGMGQKHDLPYVRGCNLTATSGPRRKPGYVGEWVLFLSHITSVFIHAATVNQSGKQHAEGWNKWPWMAAVIGVLSSRPTRGPTRVQQRYQGDWASSTTSGHWRSLLYHAIQAPYIEPELIWLPPNAHH